MIMFCLTGKSLEETRKLYFSLKDKIFYNADLDKRCAQCGVNPKINPIRHICNVFVFCLTLLFFTIGAALKY